MTTISKGLVLAILSLWVHSSAFAGAKGEITITMPEGTYPGKFHLDYGRFVQTKSIKPKDLGTRLKTLTFAGRIEFVAKAKVVCKFEIDGQQYRSSTDLDSERRQVRTSQLRFVAPCLGLSGYRVAVEITQTETEHEYHDSNQEYFGDSHSTRKVWKKGHKILGIALQKLQDEAEWVSCGQAAYPVR